MRIRTHPSTKRSKRVCLIVTQRALGQSPKEGNSALLKCRLALQKCWSAEQCSWMPYTLSCAFWTLLLRFSDLILAPRPIFILSLWFLSLFWIIRAFFRNNYLVDKYPKINLDKVQIIHNFIVIQSSILFLCMQSYFKQ